MDLSKIASRVAETALSPSVQPDPSVVIEEHSVTPVSYMAVANLKTTASNCQELLALMNEQDDLPAWADEMISAAKLCSTKVLQYVKSQKSSGRTAGKRPSKYSHIDFTPPEGVQKNAQRGLEYRKKGGKGGLSTGEAGKQGIGSGVARATSLSQGSAQSPETVRKMKAFFDRHEKNKSVGDGMSPWEDAGHVAWLLWGGDAGRSWAEKVCRQMDAADEK